MAAYKDKLSDVLHKRSCGFFAAAPLLNGGFCVKKHLRQFALMLIGTFLVAVATSVFYTPNKIVCGGVSGMATILYYTFSIPLGLSYAVINIALLLLGYRVLGRDFTLKTLVSIVMLSIFIEIMSHVPVATNNLILAVLFGGILYGCGLGITFISGSTTGGTDILGRLLQYKYPTMPIGKLLLLIDGMVIAVSLIVFKQMDLVLLGIVGLFVQTLAVDALIKRMNISKLAFVITDRGTEIAKKLISGSPRGVTIINVIGAYTMQDKQLLLCALKESEITQFQNTILAEDSEAFVIFSESQFIVGNGFLVYR